MSTVATILTTAVVVVGAVRLSRHLNKRFARAEAHLKSKMRPPTEQDEAVTITATKNTETGVFEV